MNWSEFFHMGGYAFYVWGSYFLAFIVIALEVGTLMRRAKQSNQPNRDSSSNRK